jgi:uncharacterized protein with PIN domain
MTDYYFDTSALVKLYHDELNTSVVEEFFSNEENQIFISEIACIELYSALYRLRRMNQISEDVLDAAIASFEDDCAYRLAIQVVTSHNIEQAKAIIKRYGHNKSIRTLDAIQLSTSLGRTDNLLFVCADTLLSELAQNEKLKVLDLSR